MSIQTTQGKTQADRPTDRQQQHQQQQRGGQRRATSVGCGRRNVKAPAQWPSTAREDMFSGLEAIALGLATCNLNDESTRSTRTCIPTCDSADLL
mmetsp:Transcript_32692/g.49361  ORF Transcript_32692/g.49361 Transcript_32692/m.49361 type:complete len:95 (-) Transcript_32692:33-317(-)